MRDAFTDFRIQRLSQQLDVQGNISSVLRRGVGIFFRSKEKATLSGDERTIYIVSIGAPLCCKLDSTVGGNLRKFVVFRRQLAEQEDCKILRGLVKWNMTLEDVRLAATESLHPQSTHTVADKKTQQVSKQTSI